LLSDFQSTLEAANATLESTAAFDAFVSTVQEQVAAYLVDMNEIESTENANIASINSAIQTAQNNIKTESTNIALIAVTIGLDALDTIGAIFAFPEEVDEILKTGLDAIEQSVDNLDDASGARAAAQQQVQDLQAGKQAILSEESEVTQVKELLNDYIPIVEQAQLASGIFLNVVSALSADTASCLAWAQGQGQICPALQAYETTQATIYRALATTMATWANGFLPLTQ